MKITLLYPPLDDPTMPYHSLAYLAGHLIHSGFGDVSIRDINAEYIAYCLHPDIAERFQREACARFDSLSALDSLGFEEQEQYFFTWMTQEISPQEISRAAAELRNREAFLDFDRYLENVKLIVRYFGLIGALSYPAELQNMRHRSRGRYSLYVLDDLLNSDLSRRICRPLDEFFCEKLRSDQGLAGAECLGISVIYDHQLPYALYLARRLKETFPEKLLVMGGTAIGQLYKYLDDKNKMRRFFNLCDAIVVGEGETAICEIADTHGSLTGRNVPNMITFDAALDVLHLPAQIHYEDVNSLGRPVYDFPWHLYLSPEPGFSYAPTRGCYWNRCTFCDYGLNTDKPTSPWRERAIDRVVEDLIAIRARHNARFAYFAVDVMAPGYIERLSDAIVDSELDIRWSAELRMEKIFSEHRCLKMAKSGCVCVSFGMESGNQRILDLIDKGTRVDYMAATMKNFASADVAVQLMAFSDFPTETGAEKKDTIDFVNRNSEYWSTGGIGTFMLTGSAIIAKNPEKFGIRILKSGNADLNREIAYRAYEDTERTALLTEEGDESFGDAKDIFPNVPKRPWAGGTDTLHSMIYYDVYGKEFFKQHNLDSNRFDDGAALDESLLSAVISVRGTVAESAFDVSAILANQQKLSDRVKQLLRIPMEPADALFKEWQNEIEPLPKQAEGTYWIARGDDSARLSPGMFKILTAARGEPLTVRRLLEAVSPAIRDKVLEKLRALQQRGFVRFQEYR